MQADVQEPAGRGLAAFWERRGEMSVTLMLASATVLTAWSGYQSAKWSGLQAISFSEAGAARADSNAAVSLGGQDITIDVVMFTQWLSASNDLLISQDASVARDDPNQIREVLSDPARLPGFLSARFSSDLSAAFEDWLALDPFTSDLAPNTPFEMDTYTVETFVAASDLRDQATESARLARVDNQQSDNYVILTVLFATVLFLAGLSSKLRSTKSELFVAGLGAVVLTVAVITLLRQPIEFGEFELFS